MTLKYILSEVWHFAQWFYRNREWSYFTLSVTILVSVILLREAGKPIEYVQEAHAQEEVVEEVMIEVSIDWTRDRINQEIEKKADEYGAQATTLKRIVACESGYVTDIQSHHILNGKREESYGLAQIHLPSHPHVSYEEAIDPAFAIDYLAKHYAQGTDKWSCK